MDDEKCNITQKGKQNKIYIHTNTYTTTSVTKSIKGK